MQQHEEVMVSGVNMQSGTYQGLHIAIIMDGNGRWAVRRGLPRICGHRAGVVAVRRTVERAVTVGIGRLTLYAFSSDNWRRPLSEVQGIFRLLRIFLRMEAERLRQHGIRLQVIGRRDRLSEPVLREIEKAESLTLSGDRLLLCIAIDYSSRDAIACAASKAAVAFPDQSLPLQELVRTMLTQTLIAESGAVDLLIRTGGEKRLSDFLLWESAYAELFFTDRMWPEFDAADFDLALEEFDSRERRFGGVPATLLRSETATT